MYYCNNCRKTFATPCIDSDHENDEEYELCPHCFYDDITQSPDEELSGARVDMTTKPDSLFYRVALIDSTERTRRLFSTIDFRRAVSKMNFWRKDISNS